MDHVLRYQDTPGIKMIVVLGEVGAASKHSFLIGCITCDILSVFVIVYLVKMFLS